MSLARVAASAQVGLARNPASPIPKTGAGGRSAEESLQKAALPGTKGFPQIIEKLFVGPSSQSGPPLQGPISETTEQTQDSMVGPQDLPCLLLGGRDSWPCFFLFNTKWKLQP